MIMNLCDWFFVYFSYIIGLDKQDKPKKDEKPMIITASLFIIAITLYIFYKVKAVRIKQSVTEKTWVNAKGSICLGAAILIFGINNFFLNPTTLMMIISVIFIIIGGYYLYQSIMIYRYFSKKMRGESS